MLMKTQSMITIFSRLVKSGILTNKLLHYVYDFSGTQTMNRFLLYSHLYI